jgi:methylated-DNA-[protein]-cysteine S-methyltransferase
MVKHVHSPSTISHFFQKMPSPVGELFLVSTETHLTSVLFGRADTARAKASDDMLEENKPVLQVAKEQLEAYFAGKLTQFDLPLLFYGTDFQQLVWKQLLLIPFGKTISYGQMATALGDIKASRAVGAANGKNPIAIIAPCHRVIGASGDLVGFAGGMAAKEYLLRHEGVLKDSGQMSLF